MSKVQCQFCSENCTTEGNGEKREEVQISQNSKQNLWPHKLLAPLYISMHMTSAIRHRKSFSVSKSACQRCRSRQRFGGRKRERAKWPSPLSCSAQDFYCWYWSRLCLRQGLRVRGAVMKSHRIQYFVFSQDVDLMEPAAVVLAWLDRWIDILVHGCMAQRSTFF